MSLSSEPEVNVLCKFDSNVSLISISLANLTPTPIKHDFIESVNLKGT